MENSWDYFGHYGKPWLPLIKGGLVLSNFQQYYWALIFITILPSD